MSPRNRSRARWIAVGLLVLAANAEALGVLTGTNGLRAVAKSVLISPYTNPFVNYPSLEQIDSGDHNLGFFWVDDSGAHPWNIIAHFNSHPYAFETRMAVVSGLRNAHSEDPKTLEVFDTLVCLELARSLKKSFLGYGVGSIRRSCDQNKTMK